MDFPVALLFDHLAASYVPVTVGKGDLLDTCINDWSNDGMTGLSVPYGRAIAAPVHHPSDRFGATTDTGEFACPATCRIGPTSVCGGFRQAKIALFDRPLRAVRAREVIFRIADSARTVFIIHRGMVRLSRSLADGRCQILGFGVAEDILGLSGTDEYTYDAEALTEAQFCTIPTTDMMRRVERSPSLGRLLVEAGQRDLRRAHEQLTLLGKMTALEKLAAFYVQMARLQKVDRDDRVFAAIPLTGEDIGDYLGLRFETVSRNQRKLRECGVVRPLPGSDRVEIRDMALLLRLAEGVSPRGSSAWA